MTKKLWFLNPEMGGGGGVAGRQICALTLGVSTVENLQEKFPALKFHNLQLHLFFSAPLSSEFALTKYLKICNIKRKLNQILTHAAKTFPRRE